MELIFAAIVFWFVSILIKTRDEIRMTNNGANTEQTQQLNAVAVKLPPFWMKFPQGWFTRAESMFRRSNITAEDTKYDHVLSVLPEETIADIFDIIEQNTKYQADYPTLRAQNPDTPAPTPYTNLKSALINRNTLSERQRLEQILSRETIGNRKPSEFYRHLRQISGDSKLVTDELIKSLWLRNLPPQIHQSLISSGKNDVNELSSLADTLFEVVQNTSPSVFATSSGGSFSEDRLVRLETQIATLAKTLETMNMSNSSHGRNRSRSRSGKRRDTSAHGSDRMCFYHRRYKDKARKCVSPCSYKSEN